eukprot:TRINITY_DN733_c2_g1_i1.p1 TRINITY_DN733_c2_g1~~TRINITY_DN733_c2_g1_i1.p1  ORF type:complete len:367 (+),score=90.84 TRINITY_DN733_c2_g1_i1:63-1163(+)
MGAAATKCSELNKASSIGVKPLEASSSEGEDDADEVYSEEDEDDEEDGDEIKEAAEDAINQGLRRGKTATFKEAIEHATSVGIDLEKIMKAEAKLEEHKQLRRREALEDDIREYLGDEANQTIEVCRDKLEASAAAGCSEKLLNQLKDRIAQLDLDRPLSQAEIRKCKDYVLGCTRRYASSVVLGRATSWVDLDTGDLTAGTLKLDIVLSRVSVRDREGQELGACDLCTSLARRPEENEKVSSSSGFETLSSADRDRTLVVESGPYDDPWCLLEEDRSARDEAFCALMVLAGRGMEGPQAVRASIKAPSIAVPSKDKEEEEEEEENNSARSPRGAKRDKGSVAPPPLVPQVEEKNESGSEEEEEDD